MNRRRRCKILIDGTETILDKISKEIEDSCSIQVIDKPNEGVVMVKMRDSAKNGPFYIGEVLVSESKIEVNGNVGIGIIKGHHPNKAYKLALIDGAYNSCNSNIKKWNKILLKEEKNIEQQHEIFNGKVRQTKVDFNTMSDQGVSLK